MYPSLFDFEQSCGVVGYRAEDDSLDRRCPAPIVVEALEDGDRAGAGVVAGWFCAVVRTPLLESMLYGVAPNDVWTLAGAALSILGLGLLAALIPARRATQIDPMRVLTEG